MRLAAWRRRGAAALIAALVAGAAFLPDGRALAQDYQHEVAARLAPFVDALGREGFRLRSADSLALRRNGTSEHFVTLQAGRDHALIIGCDFDCRDATLAVFDEHGKRVGEAVGPVVFVRPLSTGRFRVHSTLLRCDTGICEVGVALLSR